jgi:hypothetical protein
MRSTIVMLLAWPVLCPGAGGQEKPPTGFQAEVSVRLPTRLDWEFCTRDFDAKEARLRAGYESARQRYQLYVPPAYQVRRTWPLVLFLSPGDDPFGWRHWEALCERKGILFAAAYGAGNGCPVGQRVRIVLDVLDDVRRRYRVDPDQTYLTGFGGGAELACTLAFSLPEYFGGVLAVSGAAPLPRLESVKDRALARLSVALVAGERDHHRGDLEGYYFTWFTALGMRTRCGIVPGRGFEMPPPATLEEALDWLATDLLRRQATARARPELAAAPQDVPTDQKQAARALAAAEADAVQTDNLLRVEALLREITLRWPRTDAAATARMQLQALHADPRRQVLWQEQREKAECRELAARAKALEKRADLKGSLAVWQELSRRYPASPEGKDAAEQIGRLRQRLEATPWLGLALEGETLLVQSVTPDGPAARAGVRPGDRLEQLGECRLNLVPDLREALAGHRPGERVRLGVRRGDGMLNVEVVLGRAPLP